jgi:hypothetical protein
MARHADGTIVINTAIETDGFKKGSKDMEAAFRKAAHNLEGVSEKIQISIEKSVQAFEKQNAAYREQEARVESLKAKIEEAQSEKVESQAFTDINKQIDDYQKKLDAAIEREIRFMETGGSTRSTAYERMEYDIEMLREKIAEAKAEKDRLLQSGEAYTGADISGLTSQLTEAQDKLGQMGGKLEASYASLRQKMDEYSEKAEESAKKTNIFKSAIDRLNSSARSSGSGIGGALKKFIKYGLGMASVYMLFNKLRAAIKDGIKSIVQFDKKTNTSISGIQSAFAKLKNNLTAAIAPLINALAPYIIKVVDWLNQAITQLAIFFAQLTGQKTYIQAKDVWKDYAQGLKDTSAAAKEAKKNLSGLDEIKTWDSGSFGGSGGSGSGTKAEDMFVTKKLDSSLGDIDWKSFGAKISDGFINVMSKTSTWLDNIPWDDIGTKIGETIKGIDWGGALASVGGLVYNLVNGISEAISGLGKALTNEELNLPSVNEQVEDLKTRYEKISWIINNMYSDDYQNAFFNYFGRVPNEFDSFRGFFEPGYGEWLYDIIQNEIKLEKKREETAKKAVDKMKWLEMLLKNDIISIEEYVKRSNSAYKDGILTLEQYNELLAKVGLTSTEAAAIIKKNAVEAHDKMLKTAESLRGFGENAGRGYVEGLELELRNGRFAIIDANNTIVDNIRNSGKGLISQIVAIFGKQALERANQKAAKAAGEAIGDALGNGIISSVNQTNAHVADYTEFLIGQLEDSMKPGEDYYKKKAAIRKLKSFTVPYLASGAVIPPNAPFTAVLGDQKHGTNVEAPLETIKQALREVLGSGTGGGNTYNITATANGKTLFQLLLEEGRNAQMQTGKNPFLLA